MKTSNPFVPTVTLIDLPQRNRREQFKIGMYTVLIAQLVIVLGLLMYNKNGTSAVAFASDPYGTAPVQPETATIAATRSDSPVAEPSATLTPTAALLGQSVQPVAVSPSASASPATQPTEASYVVKSGDTLSRIARIHGITIKALKSANSLDSERLTVGRKLKIPETKA